MKLMRLRMASGFLLAAVLLAADADMERRLEAAIHREMVVGDLMGAIEQYKKLAQGKERAVAAKALVRMGQCYEKLGDAESRKAYERVVREFGDQKEAAEAARVRLAAIGAGAAGKGVVARRVADIGDLPFWRVSRDGRYTVEMNTSQHRGTLVVRDLVTGDDRVVARVDSPTGNVCCMIVSPDTRQFAYGRIARADSRGELYTMGIDGSNRRVLVAGETNVSFVPNDWSPDGKHILAWVHTEGKPGPIVVVSVADGSYRAIEGDSWTSAQFSADGSHILFREHRAPGYKSSDIFFQPVAGGPKVLLLQDAGRVDSLAATPDGRRVLFVSDRNGSKDLWAIRVSDHKAAGQPELVQSGVSLLLGFTRDGGCYYQKDSLARDLYVAGVDPQSGKITVAPKRLTTHNVNAGAAWSPDGESLAYYVERRERQGNLVIRSIKTGAEREHMVKDGGGAAASSPPWFPDSRSLLMHIYGGQLVQLDAQTFQARPLLEGTLIPFYRPDSPVPVDNRYLVLAPDAKTIYFLQRQPNATLQRVMRLDSQTGTRRPLCQMDAESLADLAVSSDGSRLAFSRISLESGNGGERKTAWSLVTLPSEGGEPKEVYKTSAGRIGSATWSRDGRRLFFTGGSPRGIYSIPVEGGAPEMLDLGMTDPVHDFRFLNISPDGTQIVFADEQKSNQIWRLSNLFGGGTAK